MLKYNIIQYCVNLLIYEYVNLYITHAIFFIYIYVYMITFLSVRILSKLKQMLAYITKIWSTFVFVTSFVKNENWF